MTPPRSACGASPSRGRHQRPGKAGSAVALEWMRRLVALLLAVWWTAGLAADPVPHKDPFRGDAAFTDQTRPPPLVGAENRDLRRVRSYAMQPPTVPHAIDNYQIDRYANKCMMCHARTRAGDSQATPISITHYTDRDGNFLGDVSPRRYFCDTCHVVQMEVEAKVPNTFEDVDLVVRRMREEARSRAATQQQQKKK
jgi:cytochrome c-type protein NapB